MNDEQPKRETPSHEPEHEDDGDRDAILQRRKQFVASALAGMAMASCDIVSRPFACLSPAPCLNVAARVDDVVMVPITLPPCLTPVAPDVIEPSEPVDAAAPAPDGRANTSSIGGDDAQPRVCLRVARPRVCLSRPHDPTPRPQVCLDFKSKDALDHEEDE